MSEYISNHQKNIKLFVVVVFLSLLPEIALAAQPWDNMLNTIIGIFTGGTARLIAILVCVGLGLAAFFSKLSWRLAGGFIAGIVLIFGSAAVADFFIAGI